MRWAGNKLGENKVSNLIQVKILQAKGKKDDPQVMIGGKAKKAGNIVLVNKMVAADLVERGIGEYYQEPKKEEKAEPAKEVKEDGK